MKKLAFLYLFSVALISGIFGQKTAQLQYAFKDFDGLVISSGYDVYVEKGDNYSITITVSAEHADKVNASVSNGVLTLGAEKGLKNIKTLKAYITMPRLSSVTLSGGSDLVGNGVFISEKFRANLSGGCDMRLDIRTEKADITLSGGSDVRMNIEATDITLKSTGGSDAKLTGRAVNVSFTSSGGSDIDAKGLTAHHVTIVSSGGSDVDVHAEQTLIVNTSGACDVTYSGNPTVTSNLSGSSTLKKRK